MSSKKCDRCHEDIPENPKLTSESEPYCSHCGFVFGTSVAPAVWSCDCGETVLDHGGDDIPHCVDCEVPMSCQHASASGVHGAGIGTASLDLGLAILLEAQEDQPATAKRVVAERKELLDLGQDILMEAQKPQNVDHLLTDFEQDKQND